MLLVDSSSNHIWSDKGLAKGKPNTMQYSANAEERATEKSRVCNSRKGYGQQEDTLRKVGLRHWGEQAYGSLERDGRTFLTSLPRQGQLSAPPKLLKEPGDDPNTLPSPGVHVLCSVTICEVHMLTFEPNAVAWRGCTQAHTR